MGGTIAGNKPGMRQLNGEQTTGRTYRDRLTHLPPVYVRFQECLEKKRTPDLGREADPRRSNCCRSDFCRLGELEGIFHIDTEVWNALTSPIQGLDRLQGHE